MTAPSRQRGLAGGLVTAVLVLILVGFLASQVLSRLGLGTRASGQVTARLATLSDSLEQYAATAGRLPCPANPTLKVDEPGWGDEALATPNVGACQYPEGTVPWRTIGARREDSIDPWGWKVSYRVFSGVRTPPSAVPVGSLTQPGGVDVVECDTAPAAGAVTPVAGALGGLCDPNPDATLRSSWDENFYSGKGFRITDMGVVYEDAAYVLVSHGPTGRGAYTSNGVRTELPGTAELGNTSASGPFTIQSHTEIGTDPTATTFFDDYLFYRRLRDLTQRISRTARDWPEPPPPPSAAGEVTFDQAAVEAAVGTTITPGASVGQVTVTFVGVVVTGSGSGGSDVSFDVVGGIGGVGVAGGGSALMQSGANEMLSFAISGGATKFAVTLNDFGIYSGIFTERVQFRFFLGATEVGTARQGVGCQLDGGLATFEGDVGTNFDRIDITPLPALDDTFMPTGITALLVSQVRACPATEACATSLATPGNTCTLF